MISLAWRDVSKGFARYLLTGLGLGLLIGVTLTMSGVFRGMVDDGKALLRAADADIWVVQQHTLGPFAEPSSLPDDFYRGLLALPGVAEAVNSAYLTLEVNHQGQSIRVMLVGVPPAQGPTRLIAGRPLSRSHYELVADERSGLRPGDQVRIHRHDYRVVGLTRGLRSPSGDPLLYLPLKDAQTIQFLEDNDAIFRERRRLESNPRLNPPGHPSFIRAVEESQFSNHRVNAILVRLRPGWAPEEVARQIGTWLRVTAYTRQEMEKILIGQLIAMASRQIGLFLVILTLVSAAIVALTIYSMTQTKLREIAVLKLVGTPNRLIIRMILLEGLGLGLIGFITGKLAVTYWAPLFPKHVLALPEDSLRALVITLALCVLASLAGIRAALRVSPASAIGGG